MSAYDRMTLSTVNLWAGWLRIYRVPFYRTVSLLFVVDSSRIISLVIGPRQELFCAFEVLENE